MENNCHIVSVVDDFYCVCPGMEVNISTSELYVVHVAEGLSRSHLLPEISVVDNSPACRIRAFLTCMKVGLSASISLN